MGHIRREYKIPVTRLAIQLANNESPDMNTIALAFRQFYGDNLEWIEIDDGAAICEFQDVVLLYQFSPEAIAFFDRMLAKDTLKPCTLRFFRWFKAADPSVNGAKDPTTETAQTSL